MTKYQYPPAPPAPSSRTVIIPTSTPLRFLSFSGLSCALGIGVVGVDGIPSSGTDCGPAVPTGVLGVVPACGITVVGSSEELRAPLGVGVLKRPSRAATSSPVSWNRSLDDFAIMRRMTPISARCSPVCSSGVGTSSMMCL